MAKSSPVKTHGLTHVALAVRDPQRSMRFYQDVLGAVAVYESDDFVQVQTPGSRDVLVFERKPWQGREVRRRGALRIPIAAAGGHPARRGRRAQSGWNDQRARRVRPRRAVRVLQRSRRLRGRDRYEIPTPCRSAKSSSGGSSQSSGLRLRQRVHRDSAAIGRLRHFAGKQATDCAVHPSHVAAPT